MNFEKKIVSKRKKVAQERKIEEKSFQSLDLLPLSLTLFSALACGRKKTS
jgi:hypothetical protein